MPEEVKTINRALSLITGLSSAKSAMLYFDHYFIPVNKSIPFKEKVYFNQQFKHDVDFSSRIGHAHHAFNFFSHENSIYFENGYSNLPSICSSFTCSWYGSIKINWKEGVLYQYCPVKIKPRCFLFKKD